MGNKVKEISQASLSAPAYKGRRKDRVYEDQIWRFMCETGENPWRDPANPPNGESDFRPG